MKKRKCPQCKNLVSITAPTCLYCGRPNKFVTNEYIKKKWDKEFKKDKINFSKRLISREVLFFITIIFIILIFI